MSAHRLARRVGDAGATFARFGGDAHTRRLFIILLGLMLFFWVVRPESFLSIATWQSMAIQFPEFGIMALGVMLTMITGGIDLSVVGIANMTAITAAVTMLSIAPPSSDGGQVVLAIAVSVGLALLLGALAGAFNGLLVAKVRIPAILATLGTLELFTGVAIVITGGKPKSGLPMLYSEVFAGKLFGLIPVQLIVFVVAALVIAFLLNRTTYGLKVYAIGANATAARFSGLNSTSIIVRTYLLSGLFAALAGLVMLANYNSAKADYGSTYTLLTILIVVLGGVNPNGGHGRLTGVVLAVAMLQILSSGLNMFSEISNFYRPLIWGAVLLLVVSTSGSFNLSLRNRLRVRKE